MVTFGVRAKMDEAVAEKIVKMLVAELTESLAEIMGRGDPEFLSTTGLAMTLKVCEDTVRTWAKEGCPHIRVSKGALRFKLSHVISWLGSRY